MGNKIIFTKLKNKNIFERSFYSDPQRTTLHVRASMPEGCTVQQLNEVVRIMENYLSGFDEIEMSRPLSAVTTIRTSLYISNLNMNWVHSPITIFFKKKQVHHNYSYLDRCRFNSKKRLTRTINDEIPKTKIAFSNRTVDFGTLSNDASVQALFWIMNMQH